MMRAIFLLSATLLTAACAPCNPSTNVYWTFGAPGLTTPNGCAAAGIDTVSLWADGDFLGDLPCAGPRAEGIQIIGYGNGTVRLQLEAWAGPAVTGTRRYAYDQAETARSCDASVDVVAGAIPGRLDLEYLFSPTVACATSSYATFQLRGPAGQVHDVAPPSTLLLCGNPDPVIFPALAPGVYTLSRLEVGILTAGTPPIWTPDYNACGAQSFVHAGDSLLTTTLTPATASCWP